MSETELCAEVERLAENAKTVDVDAAAVLFTLAGSLQSYGASALAATCRDHAQEMLGRIAQQRREYGGS